MNALASSGHDQSEREATLKKPSLAIGAGFAALFFGSVVLTGCNIHGFDDDGVFECGSGPDGAVGGSGGGGGAGSTTGSTLTYVVSVGVTTGTGNNPTTGVTSSTGGNPTSTSSGSGPGCGAAPLAGLAGERILFELDGVPGPLAAEAFSRAAMKLPIKTKVVARLGDTSHLGA